MSYGMISYDDDGRVQFDTTDPLLWVDQIRTSPDIEFDGYLTNQYCSSNVFNATSGELVLMRPPAGQSGFVGLSRNSTSGARFLANQFFNPSGGTSVGGFAPSGAQFIAARTTSGIGPRAPMYGNGGYGLNVYDSSGDLTFCATPGNPNFKGYLNIMGIVPRTASSVAFPGRLIYTAPNDAEFEKCYGVMNGQWCVHTITNINEPHTIDGYEHNLFAMSYYFDEPNRSIYAFHGTFQSSSPDLRFAPVGSWTTHSPIGPDYMVMKWR